MDSLPLAALERAIQENESALRASFGDAGLPAAWSDDLAALPRETPFHQLTYFARVKHYYWQRYDALHSAPAKKTEPEAAQDAARALLTREPVLATIAGRERHVSGRSYNALVQISAHHLRIVELTQAAKHVERLFELTMRRHRGWRRRRAVRRRLTFLRGGHVRLLTETMLHRRALYAHAFTPSGAAATDVQDGHPAPWWRDTTIEDDARLFLALWEAGPGRYTQVIADAKPESDDKDGGFIHDFGFHSLVAWCEGKRRIPPAALYDHDVGQLLTSLRAAAVGTPELED